MLFNFDYSTPKAGLCPSPPMTVACSDDLGGLDLEPILLSLDKTDQMFKPSTLSGHGLGWDIVIYFSSQGDLIISY